MNWNVLQQKLLSAARKAPPVDRVPYAFEKRILARLGLLGRADPRAEEAAAVTRAFCWAATGCAAVALAVGAWGFRPESDSAAAPGFTQELEQSILASADDLEPGW